MTSHCRLRRRTSRLASQPELAEALGVIHLLAERDRAPAPMLDAEKDAAIASSRGCGIGGSSRRPRSSGAIRIHRPVRTPVQASLTGGLLQRSRRRGPASGDVLAISARPSRRRGRPALDAAVR